jgi:hypothetical protein
MRTLKQQTDEGIKARRWRQREQLTVDTETADDRINPRRRDKIF